MAYRRFRGVGARRFVRRRRVRYAARVVRRGLRAVAERKFTDKSGDRIYTSLLTPQIEYLTPGGVNAPWTTCPQGAGVSERVGTKITLKYMTGSIMCTFNQADFASAFLLGVL